MNQKDILKIKKFIEKVKKWEKVINNKIHNLILSNEEIEFYKKTNFKLLLNKEFSTSVQKIDSKTFLDKLINLIKEYEKKMNEIEQKVDYSYIIADLEYYFLQI